MKHQGLSKSQARELLQKYGPNEIVDLGQVSALKILLRQIRQNFIIYLLFFAMAISFIVGKGITGYAILAVIIAVIATGFIQEYKAEKAVIYLKQMVMPLSLAIRDGEEKEIPSSELVPGDIIILRTGEKIPADCVVMEEKDILVNESILTGEAKEVSKTPAQDTENFEDLNALFAGSFIVNGKATAQVVHTGMNTRFGKIADMISTAEKELPLQVKVNRISKYMALVGFLMASLTGFSVLFLAGEISQELIIDVLILTIAISVSAFPESFPVVLITTLSVGAHKMARKNAIANRMSIIETLGETTIICSDKTGTITKGEMTVKKIFCAGHSYDISGVGYEAEGAITFRGKKAEARKSKSLSQFLRAAVLCNDARIKRSGEEKSYQIMGTPTESALLVMAAKAEVFAEDIASDRLEEIPFSSERKMMSIVVEEEKGKTVYTKGALEILLPKCKRVQTNKGAAIMTQAHRDAIIAEFNDLASRAFRTIALAAKQTNDLDKDNIEKDLVFLGLAGIEDPPREEVKESIAICKKAGIEVKMITGDNRDTAVSVAKQIGLKSGAVVDGDELDRLTDDELAKTVNGISIFARVRPEHKLRIVKALKNNGEIVTMTGDGVNDSPALKEAHIGVAMGKNGTDVSRSVADLTLKDDNFATIVDAIREGRTIFNNIRKFTTYQLSCNYAELTILFVGVLLSPILGWPVPILLALHILFVNLITDNLPSITLGLNNSSPDIMESPPRKNAHIFTPSLIIVLAISSLTLIVAILGTFWFCFNVLGQDVPDARTSALAVMVMLRILGAFSFRSFRKGVLNRSPFANKYLVYASLVSLAAILTIVYTPARQIFETVPLTPYDWLGAIILALAMVGLFDLLKAINNKKKILTFD